jgi:hypothetical protein
MADEDVFFIDGSGEFIAGDFITALLAESFLMKHPGSTIIYDVRASYAVDHAPPAAGQVLVTVWNGQLDFAAGEAPRAPSGDTAIERAAGRRAGAESVRGRIGHGRERVQPHQSNSTLVNSGNAAILGMGNNSLKITNTNFPQANVYGAAGLNQH